MKLKATARASMSASLFRAINEIRPKVIAQVLVPHLRVDPKIGPAELFVQETDLADAETHEPFIHVGLSGVSMNAERSDNDFLRARDALVALYRDLIIKHRESFGPTERAGRGVQLFVVIYLDAKHRTTGSSLVESAPEWVSLQ